jgi:hypothetical protein
VSEPENRDGFVRVFFALEQDEDGYPPVGVETLWARKDGETGRLVLDNIPFFATQAALGDVVSVTHKDGKAWYESTLQRSGNSLIRVLCHKGTDPSAVRQDLEKMGCATEWLPAYCMVAVSLSPSVELTRVQEMLQQGAAEDKWGYEEPILMQ